ncbi:MAG: hypothetical protein IKY12_05075 [Clostridia bacterium]|nr:hypothetical protein [Clostridia bacterium]
MVITITVRELFDFVDEVRPNAYSDRIKTVWLNEAEGLVSTEVYHLPKDKIKVYDVEINPSEMLSVDEPHSKLYYAYILAMIDFTNGEFARYENSSALFNAFYLEFVRYYSMKNYTGGLEDE